MCRRSQLDQYPPPRCWAAAPSYSLVAAIGPCIGALRLPGRAHPDLLRRACGVRTAVVVKVAETACSPRRDKRRRRSSAAA